MCSEELPGLTIEVRRAAGTKCDRCWTYSIRVGENSDYPTICERCVAALYEIDDTIDGASS
jgi:isoleucyl-tRNA synthetase